MASKMKSVRIPPTSVRLNISTVRSDRPVTARYSHDTIQNTGTPMRTSRSVPPPIAVTRPTTYAPNQSKFLAAASLIPEMANEMVPNTSMTMMNVVSSIFLT